MSAKQLAFVGCRLLAVYSFVHFINTFQVSIIQIVANRQNVELNSLNYLSAMTPLIMFLLSILLWFGADYFSHMTMESKEVAKNDAKISGRNLYIMGLSIVGVIVIADAIPKTLYEILNYFLYEKTLKMDNGLDIRTKIRIVADLVQLLIGFYLFLGSKGLTNLFQSLRAAGIKKHDV